MKVLELFGEPISNGGQESFVISVVSHINDDSIHIDLLTPYYCDNSYYEEMIKRRGGKVYSLGVKFNPGGDRRSIIAPLTSFFKKNSYDVVHIHSGSISVLSFAAKASKKAGVKMVITHSHCGIERPGIKNTLLRYWASLSMKKNVDFYCACSYEAAIAKYPKIIAEKALIIKNGVDLNKFIFNNEKRDVLRSTLNISKDTVVIGHVGRFNAQKNHSFLLDVFYEFHKEYPESILMLVGSGELKKDIENKAKNLCILNYIRFIGNVNNVEDYMQIMDVFALPSLFEGLPIVGVEAQASGLPIVVSQNVSRELEITSNVFFSNRFCVAEWVGLIEKALNYGRKDVSLEIEQAGFNIQLTADMISDIYKKY